MKCYYNDLKKLQEKLSFKSIKPIIAYLRQELYLAMFNPHELLDFDAFRQGLKDIRQLLIDQYNSLYLQDLDAFIDKVKIFKMHFAFLDIRQDHSVHETIVEQILLKHSLISKSIKELGAQELVSILENANLNIDEDDFTDELAKDTIRNIKQIKLIKQRNGTEGCHRYIISNSVNQFSVLFVYYLFRWCGYEKDRLEMDIIPLFETMEGMANARKTMKFLYTNKNYESHLNLRGKSQTMMLGFSDGTKDGGYLQANWSIYKTKETLSELCDEHKIKAIFFDGRGGPPARGGGKTHKFYTSLGKEIANHQIQLTVQGQTISSTYGTKAHFVHNSEQLITASLSNTFLNSKSNLTKKDRSVLEELSSLSYAKYIELKNHQLFIPYLEQISTLRFFSMANIGSRPGKRNKSKELTLSDLRAISFVSSWSQLKQNVPGYFGLGTAIKTFKDANRINEIKDLFNEAPFFKALVLNSMMSLSKCLFELTAYLQKDEKFSSFWNILKEEFTLSKEMLLEISGYQILMEEEPVSRSSVAIREQIVLPLLVIQQYALQKIASQSEKSNIYEKLVVRSLYGNINASRNSV